jgi:hypothetical protein
MEWDMACAPPLTRQNIENNLLNDTCKVRVIASAWAMDDRLSMVVGWTARAVPGTGATVALDSLHTGCK